MSQVDPFVHTIVTATGPEFQAVYDRMGSRKWIRDDSRGQCRDVRGYWGSARVQLLQCGLGPVTFARNFQQSEVMANHVSMIGSCGALRVGLEAANVMLATHVTDAVSGERIALAPPVVRGDSAEGTTGGVVSAQFLCSPRIAETEPVKRDLGRRWGCDVVDMESAPFVKQALRLDVRYLILKAVSDDVSEELPPLNRACMDNGEFDLQSMARIWKGWEKSGSVRENLETSLGAVVEVFESAFLEGGS